MIKVSLLSLIQGLTEFLPVSSSGHLVLIQELLKYNPEGIGLEVLLHLSTSFAIIVYFYKKLVPFYKEYYKEVLIGIIPAGVAGIFFKGFFEKFFEFPHFLGIFFIINSLILFFAKQRGKEKINLKKALIIGFFQIFALFPGISRSGITISTALLLGSDSKDSFEFSFLMGLPLILGSGVVEFQYISLNLENTVGFILCFIFGLIALFILDKILKIKKFHYFSIYTLILGIIAFFIL